MVEVFILGGIFLFVAYRLYKTLGEDDGPPAGGSRTRSTANSSASVGRDSRWETENNTPDITAAARFTGPAAAGLAEIHKTDPTFNQRDFLAGSEQFYRMIVAAFQNGDMEALDAWLDDDVKEAWFADIQNRDEDYTPWTLRQFRFADLEAASLVDNIARIDVRFDASLARNNSTQRVREVWTLMRDVTSDNPNWMLDDVEAAL